MPGLALRRSVGIAALLCTLSLTGCFEAADDADFDFYVLAMSWSPSYCEAEGASANERQCGTNSSHGFIVHGLWPQYEEGWPEYCEADAERPARDAVAEILDVMPSEGLAHHQWRKHGTCSGLASSDYFELTERAFRSVSVPAELEYGGRHDGRDIAEAFRGANPAIPDDGISISCSDGRLREVRICLDKDLEFRSCREVASRSCNRRDLRMPPP